MILIGFENDLFVLCCIPLQLVPQLIVVVWFSSGFYWLESSFYLLLEMILLVFESDFICSFLKMTYLLFVPRFRMPPL